MNDKLPIIYLARHGETAWSLSGQHTGRTDLPLTECGERNARRLGERLHGLTFAGVLVSPLKRAVRTCELAGFGGVSITDPDLLEWNYGQYEGCLTTDIHKERPGWQLFRDGCPGGESPEQVAARADHVGARVRAIPGGCFDLFERPLSADVGGPLAGARSVSRQILHAQHRELECGQL